MQQFSPLRRAIIVIFSAFLFAVVGFVVAIVLSIYSLWPDQNPIVDAAPIMLGFALVAGLLAYRHPRTFNVFLWFMP